MEKKTSARSYGHKKDSPDTRDFKYTPKQKLNSLPSLIDFRGSYNLPDAYDQGQLGSCTANSIAFLYQFDEIKQNNKSDFMPSRLFIYYNERNMEGTVSSDSGAAIRDGIKTINTIGVCEEAIWPYNISEFAVQPGTNCYTEANNCKSLKYESVSQDLNSLKTALINGYPISFGFTVYESFESIGSNGLMSMPDVNNEQNLGGHAVAMVGYDDSKNSFIVRNSWGPDWGDNGYFYMPYAYATDSSYASDFWVIEQITDPTLSVTLVDTNTTCC